MFQCKASLETKPVKIMKAFYFFLIIPVVWARIVMVDFHYPEDTIVHPDPTEFGYMKDITCKKVASVSEPKVLEFWNCDEDILDYSFSRKNNSEIKFIIKTESQTQLVINLFRIFNAFRFLMPSFPVGCNLFECGGKVTGECIEKNARNLLSTIHVKDDVYCSMMKSDPAPDGYVFLKIAFTISFIYTLYAFLNKN